MEFSLDWTYVASRLLVAAVLGGVVGFEREARRKPAGLRTHMMVALGAAAFVMAAFGLSVDKSDTDPTRVIQGVATGIGFLGAGSILRRNGHVEGLTTAAGTWVVGAIGVASGLGEYAVAVTTAVVSAVILAGLDRFEIKKAVRPD